MDISFNARVSVAPGTLVSQLAGESVLLNFDTECFFDLDQVGTRMWIALTTSDSIQAACERLLSEYAVTPQKLRSDLKELLEKLVERGLVQLKA